jgi:hypothetical protein
MSQTSLKLGSGKLWGYKYVAHNKERIYQLKSDEVVTRVMKQRNIFIYSARTVNAHLIPHKGQYLAQITSHIGTKSMEQCSY